MLALLGCKGLILHPTWEMQWSNGQCSGLQVERKEFKN